MLEEASALVDAGLRRNPQYDYAREVRQLGAVQGVAKPGFSTRLQLERAAAGSRLGDVKPTSLHVPGKASRPRDTGR